MTSNIFLVWSMLFKYNIIIIKDGWKRTGALDHIANGVVGTVTTIGIMLSIQYCYEYPEVIQIGAVGSISK